jgi:Protein of unknown function (DUF1064)
MIRVKLRDLGPEARKQIQHSLQSSRRKTNRSNRSSSSITETTESKWRNVRTTVDEITFASKREANRYAELRIELLAGEIAELELQKTFSLDVNGAHICDYVADFVYQRNGAQIVEDAKGKATDVFRIKQALMRAIHRIDVVEV